MAVWTTSRTVSCFSGTTSALRALIQASALSSRSPLRRRAVMNCRSGGAVRPVPSRQRGKAAGRLGVDDRLDARAEHAIEAVGGVGLLAVRAQRDLALMGADKDAHQLRRVASPAAQRHQIADRRRSAHRRDHHVLELVTDLGHAGRHPYLGLQFARTDDRHHRQAGEGRIARLVVHAPRAADEDVVAQLPRQAHVLDQLAQQRILVAVHHVALFRPSASARESSPSD